MNLRLMTVRVDGDPNPDRARMVVGATSSGELIVADPENDMRLETVEVSKCRMSAVYLGQDEREWWARLTQGQTHGG